MLNAPRRAAVWIRSMLNGPLGADAAIGWWKTTVVDPAASRPHWAPHEVMLNYWQRLLDDPSAEDARYVLAPGKRASAIKKVGMHGTDTRYQSTLTSKSDWRVNVRYTVRLKIAGQKDIVQKIKLIDARH